MNPEPEFYATYHNDGNWKYYISRWMAKTLLDNDKHRIELIDEFLNAAKRSIYKAIEEERISRQ